MKKSNPRNKQSNFKGRTSSIGESIEAMLRRILANKEPITDSAPQVYTDREDGVVANTNIRTDKWEYAIEHRSNYEKSNTAKREMHYGEKTYDTMTPEQQSTFHKKFPDHKFSIAAAAKSQGDGKA